MKLITLILLQIVIASAALAASTADRQAQCANPELSQVKSPSVKTEGDAACIDCQEKSSAVKSIQSAEAAATELNEKARIHRDLTLFRELEISVVGDTAGVSAADARTIARMMRAVFNYGEATSFDNSIPEDAVATKFSQNLYKILENPDQKKILEKDILSKKEAVLGMLDSRIKRCEAVLPSLEITYSAMTSQRLKAFMKTREEAKTFFAKLESQNGVTALDISSFYAIYSNAVAGTYNRAQTLANVQTFEGMQKKIESELANRSSSLDKLPESEQLKLFVDSITSKLSAKIESGICGLSFAEAWTLYNYTASGYILINKSLREGDQSEKTKIYRDVLNSALDKLKNYDGLVKRGASNIPADQLAKHAAGNTITYDAFTSTSADIGFGGEVKYVIKSKTGKYIAPFSNSESEQEVLFKAGTKFKVLDYNLQEAIKDTDSAETIETKKKFVEITMEEVE